jgi:alpha-ketoglutarate-dependent taurine dioxygenase
MGSENLSFDRFRSGKRQAIRLSQENLVRTGYLEPGQMLPLVIEPNVENLNLVSWGAINRELIAAELTKHGGILFRGFDIASVEKFEEFIQASFAGALEYTERSSPRSQVSGNVYTSTDHPPDQEIFLHNEQSYNLTFPTRILFFCLIAPGVGGETPIADCRRVYGRLPAGLKQCFLEQGYLYVRNFGEGFGLTWQEAFQTSDPARVEEYCRARSIELEWKDGGRLRTRQRRRVAARHPVSGETSWFNHLTFFHVSTLEPRVRAALLENLAEEDLPNNTYYGDGGAIEPEVMETLRAAYQAETIAFPWRVGDVLLLDNMLVAHGRRSFSGPRKVVVGMAEPRHWDEV